MATAARAFAARNPAQEGGLTPRPCCCFGHSLARGHKCLSQSGTGRHSNAQRSQHRQNGARPPPAGVAQFPVPNHGGQRHRERHRHGDVYAPETRPGRGESHKQSFSLGKDEPGTDGNHADEAEPGQNCC